MIINNFPECILINISQINLIKTYPEEKSNRIKVIVSWKNGTKDYFFGNEEDINKILDAWGSSQPIKKLSLTKEQKAKLSKEFKKKLKKVGYDTKEESITNE